MICLAGGIKADSLVRPHRVSGMKKGELVDLVIKYYVSDISSESGGLLRMDWGYDKDVKSVNLSTPT